eukprot:5999597-Pyramimonas_sp.AAC.1
MPLYKHCCLNGRPLLQTTIHCNERHMVIDAKVSPSASAILQRSPAEIDSVQPNAEQCLCVHASRGVAR